MNKHEFILKKLTGEDGKQYLWDFMRFLGESLLKIPDEGILSERVHAAIVLKDINHFNAQVILAYFLDYCDQFKADKLPRLKKGDKFFLPNLIRDILRKNAT